MAHLYSAPEHVLVTGSSGLIGTGVLAELRSRGIGSTSLNRREHDGLRTDRAVVGSAGDPQVVANALEGADAVIHLAAAPTPDVDDDHVVFSGNVTGTYVVLEEAARAGIERVVIASSINALGVRFHPRDVTPPYVPVDHLAPTQAADPYSLSKWLDEETARAAHRRHGMDVVALRYPLTGGFGDRLPEAFAAQWDDPAEGTPDLWGYLTTEDAARAAVDALQPREHGVHVAYVAAPTTCMPQDTAELLDTYLPDVPRRRDFVGRQVPMDLDVAERVFGFTAPDLSVTELRERCRGAQE
ncbi:MAG TPA: NAD(P)-dependent oxidoreductase [Beutenbergiaceae bacterium]|nr:NAD(P)-dependent oxidoreductase [Beutenbergiaceae bacterium]